MSRLHVFHLEEEKDCHSCGWGNKMFFVIAENEKEAEQEMAKDEGLCGDCIALVLADEEVEFKSPLAKVLE